MRAIILLALLGSAFAVPKVVDRIIGGSDTTVEQFPYMANMQYGWLGSLYDQACGGALLTNNLVVSAAHCYSDDPTSWWRVYLGTSIRSTGGIRHNVERITRHPDFNKKPLDADIALIHLLNHAVYSNKIQPARIAGLNYVVPDGSIVTAIGWGTNEYGISPEQLQRVDINVINQELCAERYAHLKTTDPDYEFWPDVTDGMLCAGILDVGGKDTCSRDSGGPLAHMGDILVGVTSWGYRCADAFYPGVYSRISSYTQWIVDNA